MSSNSQDNSVYKETDTLIRPSDAEITQLLSETTRLYEEAMRLTDLADFSEMSEPPQPSYSWDTPIGLVVKGD